MNLMHSEHFGISNVNNEIAFLIGFFQRYLSINKYVMLLRHPKSFPSLQEGLA